MASFLAALPNRLQPFTDPPGEREQSLDVEHAPLGREDETAFLGAIAKDHPIPAFVLPCTTLRDLIDDPPPELGQKLLCRKAKPWGDKPRVESDLCGDRGWHVRLRFFHSVTLDKPESELLRSQPPRELQRASRARQCAGRPRPALRSHRGSDRLRALRRWPQWPEAATSRGDPPKLRSRVRP